MICPNCKGEGSENNPPMRRCGVCKGTGHIPDSPPVKGVDPAEESRSAPSHKDSHGQ